MQVIKIAPRGYCYGVVDAMILATRAAEQKDLPRPIYILGMIVHNAYVVEAFSRLGIITLDGPNRLAILDQIEQGTVIFTAHGVSPEVIRRAKEKGLHVIDATCPDVTRTHRLIEEKVQQGYDIVYVGKHGHPEPEGAVGVAPDSVYLVESAEDVRQLPADLGRSGANHEGASKIVVTSQTTMSQWDTQELVEEVLLRYPAAEVHNEICKATQIRQNAVAEQARSADLCLVVGDPRSNNSGRLAQVATEVAGVSAYRIADLTELKLEWLQGAHTVAVTSGASTPTPITREVIEFLEQYDPSRPETGEVRHRIDYARLLPTVRSRSEE